MKTIILSDVNSKWESVIPYGLRVARAFESETDILYVIDKRLQQGKYNPHSDSQSISPTGETLSQDEIIQREQNRANLQLDKMLSKEVSRLNFPLRVNRKIKGNGIENELETLKNEGTENLFIASAEPDNYMFSSKNDLLAVLKETGISTLLVPPRLEYKDFERVLLPVDFSAQNYAFFRKYSFFLERYKPLINAVDVATEKNYTEKEAAAGAWKQAAKEFITDDTLKTNTLKNDNRTDGLIAYAEKNNFDLVLIGYNSASFTTNELVSLLNELKVPVLLFFD